MKIEDHIARIQDSLKTIEDCVQDDIVARQRSIAFSASAAASDLFELYLHKNDLISAGTYIQHNWMRSIKRMKEKFPFDFQNKDEILTLLYYLEKDRDRLCYGKRHPESTVINFLETFQKIKKLLLEMGVDEI